MNDNEFQELLNKATEAAARHQELSFQVAQAFAARYGKTWHEVETFFCTDALDHGQAEELTVSQCDAEMARAGYPRKKPV